MESSNVHDGRVYWKYSGMNVNYPKYSDILTPKPRVKTVKLKQFRAFFYYLLSFFNTIFELITTLCAEVFEKY